MSDRTASSAFFVEVRTAIAPFSNILIDGTIVCLTAESAHGGVGTERGQVTVGTAPSALAVPVDRTAKLIGCELSVGVARQKIDQCLASVRFVGLFGHVLCVFLFQFENGSQIITQTRVFFNVIVSFCAKQTKYLFFELTIFVEVYLLLQKYFFSVVTIDFYTKIWYTILAGKDT